MVSGCVFNIRVMATYWWDSSSGFFSASQLRETSSLTPSPQGSIMHYGRTGHFEPLAKENVDAWLGSAPLSWSDQPMINWRFYRLGLLPTDMSWYVLMFWSHRTTIISNWYLFIVFSRDGQQQIPSPSTKCPATTQQDLDGLNKTNGSVL